VKTQTAFRIYAVIATLAIVGAAIGVALADAPPVPAQPTPAEKAIEYRQAVYKVVAANFQPLAQLAQGKAEFQPQAARVNAERLAAIAGFVGDAYPDISREGNTRAKAEIWSNRTAFDQRVAEFNEHARELAAVTARSDSVGPELKAAVAAVGNDCKGCHEKFRSK